MIESVVSPVSVAGFRECQGCPAEEGDGEERLVENVEGEYERAALVATERMSE